MAKSTSKKNPREELEKQYWHVLLTKGHRPSSVYAFTEEIGMEEAEFYKHAASFDALESGYWDRLEEETIKVLHEDGTIPTTQVTRRCSLFSSRFLSTPRKTDHV